MINLVYLFKKLRHFNDGKYFFTNCILLKRNNFQHQQSILKQNIGHQFFCHQFFLSLPHAVEQINFVDIIQLKELCIVLKEFTASFVGILLNITVLVFWVIKGSFLYKTLSKTFLFDVYSED